MNQKPEPKSESTNETEMLGVKSVAQALGVSRATILRWVRDGKIDGFFRIGHKWLIRKSDFDSSINQRIIKSSKQDYEAKS
jgi:excisionase family DNA binding protein